jgi:hypothetical protein
VNVRLHAPTIEHIRGLIAAERKALPVDSTDVAVRGAAVIAHDVLGAIDMMLGGLMAPGCASCEAKRKGVAA